jgi:hypothetical protein
MVLARHALIALAVLTAVAHADAPTGLVVVGDANLTGGLQSALDGWLTHHGRTVTTDALDRDGILTITNCVNLQDLACARAVVEKRAKTAGVVFAQVASTREQTVTVQVFWIVKGHEPVAERRACEECSADALKGTVDTIMTVLAPQAGGGARIKIASKPEGATVVLDREVIGVAPIERDVAVGPHEVVLMKGTHEVGRRSLNVHADETAEITIPVKEPVDIPVAQHGSRVPGAIVLGVGIAGIAAGSIMYFASQTDDGTRYKYLDTRPAGIAVGIGGVAATAIGLLLLKNASSSDSAPVVAIDPHGGYVGWARAF